MTDALPHPVHDAQFYAGVGARRVVAFLVDAAAIALISGVLTLVFGVATLGFGFAMALPILLAVSFLYRYAALARWSATPGMALCGIELRRGDGARLGEVEAALHTAVYLGCFYTVAPQMLSIAMMAVSPMGRGLPDLVANATMINRPA
jgi:uncharacterized RDD family membrane protein YckC